MDDIDIVFRCRALLHKSKRSTKSRGEISVRALVVEQAPPISARSVHDALEDMDDGAHWAAEEGAAGEGKRHDLSL